MKLADCLKAYQYNSGQASTNVRQLALAALGAIWLFKTNDSGGQPIGLPLRLWWVGGLSIAALFFDFVQYLWNAAAWGGYHRKQELSCVDENTNFLAPRWINWPGNGFFIIKVFCTALSYILLLIFLVEKIRSF